MTSSEITSNFNNYTIHGTNNSYSVDISQGSSNNNVQNSTGVDFGNYNDFDLSTVTNSLYSNLSGFLKSIEMIVHSATLLLVGLPPEIYSVLIGIFGIGIALILIKIIRG